MNKVNRLGLTHQLVLITFGFSNIATAFPTPTSTTNTTELTTSSGEPPQDRLRRLCNSSLDMGHLDAGNYAIIKAVADGLEKFYQEHPDEEIGSCVVQVPKQRFYVDEYISNYNVSKNSNERFGTAFLLVGKARGITMKDSQTSCSIDKTFIAGESEGVSDDIPKEWEDEFYLKDAIALESAQKLIGIPIDVNKVALAKDYHVSIARKIWGSFSCNGFNYRPTFRGPKKDNLIKITGSGGVVSGITNIKAINYSGTFRGCRTRWAYRHSKTVAPESIYSDMVKVELHPMGMNYPEGYQLVKISNNHLFQINETLVNVAMKANDEDIVSSWLNERVFISFRNNTFSACSASQTKVPKKDVATPLKINVQYEDFADNANRVHVLDFQNNKMTTDVGEVLDLNFAPNSESLIKDNDFTLLGFTEGRTAGIIISGITKPEFADMPAPDFTFQNNNITGFMTSITLKGLLNLRLDSNKLRGKYLALGREDYQIYPIKLSGDNNNSYLTGVELPCEGLERTNIEGGFIFSDGKPCPSSYAPMDSSRTTAPVTSLAATDSYSHSIQPFSSAFSQLQANSQTTAVSTAEVFTTAVPTTTVPTTAVSTTANGYFSQLASAALSQNPSGSTVTSLATSIPVSTPMLSEMPVQSSSMPATAAALSLSSSFSEATLATRTSVLAEATVKTDSMSIIRSPLSLSSASSVLSELKSTMSTTRRALPISTLSSRGHTAGEINSGHLKKKHDESSLSPGAKGGIAVAAVLTLGLITGTFVYRRCKGARHSGEWESIDSDQPVEFFPMTEGSHNDGFLNSADADSANEHLF